MVSNDELAKIFDEFASILELEKGDRFRIIAFQRAAQTIKSHGESLQEIYEREGIKGLDKIPGIGEGIAKRIEEFIKTGKIKDLEKIKKKAPKAEVDFLQIPGIGPKTAVKLYRDLKAKNIPDLKNKLKTTEIFKEKTKKNLLQGIEILKGSSGRVLLSQAREIADEIIEFLKDRTTAKDIVAVGSLRRWKETIGDIDIVASSSEPEKVMDIFSKFGDFNKIVLKGNAKTSAIHASGLRVDLEILPADEYGSLLQHLTGSKEHNVALRTYALTKGMSISEHGIKVTHGADKGETIKCVKEEQVYKTLNMAYIEPELREDRGEIEAALTNKLPDLVELKDIKGDLHIHSNYSDGRATIAEIAGRAVELKYDYIAIADHTVGLGIAGGLSAERFAKRQKEIDSAQKKFPQIKILSSCEVNIKADGDLDLPDEVMAKFDIVTASVHTSFRQEKDVMTRRIIKAINHPYVDFIGHPSGRMLNVRESYEVDWQEVFTACAAKNVALEINSFPIRLDLSDRLVFEARKKGVKFVISTDAHELEHLDYIIYGISVARRGWCEKKDIINTLGYGDIRRWSRRD